MIINKPWIDTDPFLDIAGLKAIEWDIIKGICLSDHDIAAYGSIVTDAQGREDFLTFQKDLINRSPDDSLRQAYFHIVNDKTSTAIKKNSLKLFVKLHMKMYSGGTCVVLRRPLTYRFKNHEDSCKDTENIRYFPSLMRYIDSLPFVQVGRVILFVNDHDLITPLHLDDQHAPSHCNDFLWFRPNLVKKFYVWHQGIKSFITSHSAFFNEQDYHGTDPSPRMCFSIRVDGVFTDHFKSQIGIKHLSNYNA